MAYKKATKKKPEHILITVELTADLQKDNEIIPFDPDEAINRANIEAFMEKYVFKPFTYEECKIGAEINFNKIFYKPEALRPVEKILEELKILEGTLADLELSL